MAFNNIKKILAVALLALPSFSGLAASSIQASLDSTNLVMGRLTDIHLKVTRPTGVKGELLYTRSLGQDGLYPVCGDSIELRAPHASDTTRTGANITIVYKIPMQAFDSGLYLLPELLYLSGQDTLRSNRLTLKVLPVRAKAEDAISDYASYADPENPSIFDFIPDWVLDFWWLLLIILFAIAAGLWALKTYRRKGYIIPPKPQPTPYEVAIRQLNKIKAESVWQKGHEKEYYTDLTDALRRYLEGRFGINAREMTSRQILMAVGKEPELKNYGEDILHILDMADFVKFAKVRPLPDDNVRSIQDAISIVEGTKPAVSNDEEEGKGGAS